MARRNKEERRSAAGVRQIIDAKVAQACIGHYGYYTRSNITRLGAKMQARKVPRFPKTRYSPANCLSINIHGKSQYLETVFWRAVIGSKNKSPKLYFYKCLKNCHFFRPPCFPYPCSHVCVRWLLVYINICEWLSNRDFKIDCTVWLEMQDRFF